MNRMLLGVVIGAFLFPMVASAETLSEALLKCSNEKNSLKRLVCFDRVTKDVKQFEDGERPSGFPGLNLSNNRTAQPVERGAPAQQRAPQTAPTNADSDAEFGLVKKQVKADLEKKIYMTVAEVKNVPGQSKLLLVFDNGQIWRQTDNVRFKVKAGDELYVQRGGIGSFWLSSDSVKQRIRVKRQDNGNRAASVTPVRQEQRVVSNAPRQEEVVTPAPAPDVSSKVKKVKGKERVYMTLARVTNGPRKKFRLTFDNGQVWDQTDTSDIKLEAGEEVYLTKGVFGSFWLSKEGTKNRIRVKRNDKGQVARVENEEVSAAPEVEEVAQEVTSNKSDDVAEYGLKKPKKKVQKIAEKKVYITLAEVTTDARRKLVVVAEDGQKWKQTDTGKISVKVGDVVYLERGAIGSIWLSKDDTKKRIRVKRAS